MIATGNSCPLSYTSGTVLFVVDTDGAYIVVGDNTDLGNGWQKVKYTPQRFVTTIAKNNQASPFTPGVQVGSILLGPCMLMQPYLNDLDVGCPCNQTWAVGGIQSGTNSSATRTIDSSKCPLVNSTNGTMVTSCPESYYFNTSPKYGNARITNSTDNRTRHLEITQPNLNSTIGYNNSVSYANFSANFSCPSTLNNNPPPTESAAGHVAFNLFLLMGIIAAAY
jgi:hypothetical protein